MTGKDDITADDDGKKAGARDWSKDKKISKRAGENESQPVDVVFNYQTAQLIDVLINNNKYNEENHSESMPCYYSGDSIYDVTSETLRIAFAGLQKNDVEILKQFLADNQIETAIEHTDRVPGKRSDFERVPEIPSMDTITLSDETAIRKLAVAGLEFKGSRRLLGHESDLRDAQRQQFVEAVLNVNMK